MSIAPLALETQLADSSPHFFLGAGDDYAICSRAPGNRFRGMHQVLAWRVLGGRGRRQRAWLADFTTLAGTGLLFGLHPDRAARLPELTWPLFGAPRAVADALGASQIAAALPGPASRRELAVARVAEVRETYGRLLTDVAYRIEHAALFDESVPSTRRFTEALALWADTTPATSDAEVIRRSSMVHLTFETARRHAETVGLAHLPAQTRDAAGRAAKAARLAHSSTSAAERSAALEQVVRILNQLSLRCLPAPGDVARQLPGGPPAQH